MKIILHLRNPEDGIQAVRSGVKAWEKELEPGQSFLSEYEDGKLFDVHQNKTSISVWRIGNKLEAEK